MDDTPGGCRRWPERMWLLRESTGELLRGRCRATNLCDYCARLFAVETSEMLLLDAMEDSPQLYGVLTARELLDRPECRGHLQLLRRHTRAIWPDIRWAVLVEFQRRGALHLNLLLKGVPVADAERLHEALCGVWCGRVDAEPQAQFVGEVSHGEGLVRYVAMHFLKPDQAPPIGWRGHRYSATRDYLVRPASVMRPEARRSLQLKRALWRGTSLEVAEHELAQAQAERWRLVNRIPGGVDPSRGLKVASRAPLRRLSAERSPVATGRGGVRGDGGRRP